MNFSDEFTDSQIIDRIVNGDTAFYEIIVRRYNPFLYKTGRSYNYTHEDTQDLMQETFIDAYKNLIQFEGRSDFKTWIIRIMMNNCYRRKQKSSFIHEIVKEVDDNSKPMFANLNNETDKMIQNGELGHIIEEALGAIPEDYRLIFSLREMNGLNVAETANLLDISEGNVKVKLNRAKAMLRNEIEKMYSANEIFEFNLIYCNAMVERVMKEINQLNNHK